ncbi:MAG: glycosyltransferase family 4 protein [Phenylobacterium sp.]
MNPTIFFAPDGYRIDRPRVMGRHAAGNGFLRAAIQARGDRPMRAMVNSKEHAQAFREFVTEFDPAAPVEVIAANELERLAEFGLCYWPDPNLGPRTRHRLRVGPAAYSLCGVTHTIATSGMQGALASLPFDPVMDWDALVCTSTVAREVVNLVFDEAEALHRWRTGGAERLPRPRLPIIPLGVHCDDFTFTAAERESARAEMGLAADTVAVLSAGRLSLSAKAHPYPLLTTLQQTARETGAKLALVFAGQAFTAAVLETYREAAAELCPDVRTIFVGGENLDRYRAAWGASDIFVSLADSIQETFGLTPIEAMAAGLPALVSDWNGYKDTIREGIDGFRIATWAPAPGAGQALARNHEIEAISGDVYFYQANTAVALDLGALRARLGELVANAGLRRRLGDAGRARARETFDWSVVFKSYQALWAEQDAIRRRAAEAPETRAWLARAPRRSPAHMGPFDTFANFPTRHVVAQTIVARGAVGSPEAYRDLVKIPVLASFFVAPVVFDLIHTALAEGPLTVEALAARTGIEARQTAEAVARLAKIAAVSLREP